MVTVLLTWIHQHYKAKGDIPVGAMFLVEMITYIIVSIVI